MITEIKFPFFDTEETLTVEYKENKNPQEAGFHLLHLPFPVEDSIGYPVIHAFFRNMKATGYKRYCGFIQFIEREESKNGVVGREFSVDVTPDFAAAHIPYFSYGYPANLFDAPCRNLRDCDKVKWTAYTYLVQMPTRMNDHQVKFLTGFRWGYTETQRGPEHIQKFALLTQETWHEHSRFLSSWK